MTPTAKRQKAIKRMNLSDHTLDIDVRRCDKNRFDFYDIEDYVRELVGSRDYQFDAIKQVMTYLWGGGYIDVTDLARRNFKIKPQIQQRFPNEEIFLSHLPLPNRLSGVVHMATGTGKSYVIFAIAYLSLILGLTKRVLVLGPSSTIIEQGLREKFNELMYKPELQNKLPMVLRGKVINLLTDNDPIEDNSIVIENINATYTFGSIQDTLFSNTEEVLVLSDEVHHAYSHLRYANQRLDVEEKEGTGDAARERKWMKFIRENRKITRHIGFTGTPYNQNDYFADVVFDYSIKDALEEKIIKNINPLLNTETEEGDLQWTPENRYQVVLTNHEENKRKFSYPDHDGIPRVKPVTIFICPTQSSAQKHYENFIQFLMKKEQSNGGAMSESELSDHMRKKSICVVSSAADSEYKDELDNIEETDPHKVGGSVEFIFAVNKLSEGWDVENVFQIVPIEERVFKSKLLISQVLGRGLRIPRKIPYAEILANYPVVTVTNHERFAEHVGELVDAVTNCDMYLSSIPLPGVNEFKRSKHHFSLFNLNYIPNPTTIPVEQSSAQPQQPRELLLEKQLEDIAARIVYREGAKNYSLERKAYSLDAIVDVIHKRFRAREHEDIHFHFGTAKGNRWPEEKEIYEVITSAMKKAGIEGQKITEQNKKQIELYFNQFLPRGKKRRVFENVEGDIFSIQTQDMEKVTRRVSELDRDTVAFLSEDYEQELTAEANQVLDYIRDLRKRPKQSEQASLFAPESFITKNPDTIRTLAEGDTKSPYVVNTSQFKSPQSIVFASHQPEREFIFRLLENSKFLSAWVKSPDKNFYSINYEFWKKGKDRVRRSFNPDFFVLLDLDEYMDKVGVTNEFHNQKLKKLQDKGVQQIVLVVEIKSDEDDDEATPKKAEWAVEHFERINNKLPATNKLDLPENVRTFADQHYVFSLLQPKDYVRWFNSLREGGAYAQP